MPEMMSLKIIAGLIELKGYWKISNANRNNLYRFMYVSILEVMKLKDIRSYYV